MRAIGRGGVGEGNEQKKGEGEKSEQSQVDASGNKDAGRQIRLEIQPDDGRPPSPNTTNSRRATRGADSLSLGPRSAMPQRPAEAGEVSFCGSSDRAGRAGSARQPLSDEPTQKTSTVTGSHK